MAIKYTIARKCYLSQSDRYVTATDIVRKISWRKEQPGLHEPGLQHLITLIIESEPPRYSSYNHILRAFEPLTISLERLVHILEDKGKILPMHFVRKCARGLVEATRYLHESMDLIHAGNYEDLSSFPHVLRIDLGVIERLQSSRRDVSSTGHAELHQARSLARADRCQ